MITYTDPDEGPVTGEPGDPAYGACRVCLYRDASTGAYMYRVEKESGELDPSAEPICVHLNATYCRNLLAFMHEQDGGELRAKGCLLLFPGAATLASDSADTGASGAKPEGFPDPGRPTKYNPYGSQRWREEHPDEAPEMPVEDAKVVAEHSAQEADTAPPEPPDTPPRGAITVPMEDQPSLF